MPKIGMPTSLIIDREPIQTELSKVEWSLGGQLDGDNLFSSGTTKISLPPGKIQDCPFNGDPVTAHKFFTYTSNTNRFKLNIFDKLFDLLVASPNYSLAKGSATFTFTPNKDTETAAISPNQKTIEIAKPSNHKLLYREGDDFVIKPTFQKFLDEDVYRVGAKPAIIPMMVANFKRSSVETRAINISLDFADNIESTAIVVSLGMPELEDGDYVYMNFSFLCFYKVLL